MGDVAGHEGGAAFSAARKKFERLSNAASRSNNPAAHAKAAAAHKELVPALEKYAASREAAGASDHAQQIREWGRMQAVANGAHEIMSSSSKTSALTAKASSMKTWAKATATGSGFDESKHPRDDEGKFT